MATRLEATRLANMGSFEAHLKQAGHLLLLANEFAAAEPPVLPWHGQRRFEELFKLLASRFLLSPDHVLDAERVHARWQWLCQQKRRLKAPSLNACLRLTHYLEHNRRFPADGELLEHLQAEVAQQRVAAAVIEDDDNIALGARREQLYT